MWVYLRSHLWLKLFISYLAIIFVGGLILWITVSFAVPNAYQSHLAQMSAMMGGNAMGGMMGGQGFGPGPQAGLGLYQNFRAAVGDALTRAALASGVVAILASLLLARQLVTPLLAMRVASQRIADGHYDERVKQDGTSSLNSQDELGQLAHSFNRMAENLQQTESMRRQLVGDVAHELRTPLTTIKGSMEGLMDGVLPADTNTYQQIYQEADRLNRLVDDLQELSRVEAGAYELNKGLVRVEALLNSVNSSLGRQFAEKGVELQTTVAPGLPAVQVDEYRIGQVLTNLVGNALQYTPAGGKVTVSAENHGSEIWIAVADTGIGIPAEHLPHLFTRFYRVDKSRARPGGGSGIGLTIAKSLVEAHGGRIWAESPGPGKGSTFIFTLPVKA